MPNPIDEINTDLLRARGVTPRGLTQAMALRYAMEDRPLEQQLAQAKIAAEMANVPYRQALTSEILGRPAEKEKDRTLREQEIAARLAQSSPLVRLSTTLAGKGYGLEQNPAGGFKVTEPPEFAPLREKPIPETTAKSVSDKMELAQQADSLTKSFRSNYGGSYILGWGGIENFLKRIFPALEKADRTMGQANWWASKEALDNFERHPLFGSALTPSEQMAWRKANFDPTESPDFIKDRLKIRTQILKRGVRRAVDRLRASGHYKPAEIEALIGQSMQEFQQFSKPGLDEIIGPQNPGGG